MLFFRLNTAKVFNPCLFRFKLPFRVYSSESTPLVDPPVKMFAKKWSVVPDLRGRSEATTRLWKARYVQKQTTFAKTVTDTLGITPTSPSQVVQLAIPTAPAPIDRYMFDSYVEEYLNFKSDPSLLEEYINVYGSIRFGKILEDLDALAGSIAYAYCDDGREDTPPLTIVTASLDRIDVLHPIPAHQDIRLCGFCSFVGTSSMEISIIVETVPEGGPAALQASKFNPHDSLEAWLKERNKDTTLLAAKFTMVARDQVTSTAAPVNRLILKTDLEKRLFAQGTAQRNKRKQAAAMALHKKPPTVEEMYLLHDLYKEYVRYLDPTYHTPKPDNVVWMKDTIQQSLLICMPQDRNIHNNIFGGFLMRVAYELGYATALMFAKTKIRFVSLDDIVFKKPVPIGSFLSLTSQAVYSDSHHLQVKVRADVIDPLKSEREGIETTNEFHFRFASVDAIPMPLVMPRSYDESIRYLEGKRIADNYTNNIEYNVGLLSLQ